jgi:multidrug efflux system membrane fusion protein
MTNRLGLILAIVLAATAACSEGKVESKTPPRRAAIPVAVAAVEQKAVPLLVQAIGSVEAYSVVSIRAQVGGELMRVHIKEGQDVKKGDLLFTIDPRGRCSSATGRGSARRRRPWPATWRRPRTPRRRSAAIAISSTRS